MHLVFEQGQRPLWKDRSYDRQKSLVGSFELEQLIFVIYIPRVRKIRATDVISHEMKKDIELIEACDNVF